jgi:RNA polymerase sigma factor (sigma-70 family)
MTDTLTEFERGPLLDDGEFMFNQERLERDFYLTERVKAGYTECEPTPDRPRPSVVDGSLDEDAAEALGELWTHYNKLAMKVANELASIVKDMPAISREDLVNEAYFGLYHAAVKWHPSKQITLLMQARQLMTSRMYKFIDSTSTTIRIPAYRRQEIRKAQKTKWNIYQDTEHMPKRERVARALKISIFDANVIARDEALTLEMGSIDGGYFEDERDGHSIYGVRENRWQRIDPAATEQRAVEEEMLLEDLRRIVNKALGDHLSGQDLEMILERFVKQRTLSDLADARGVSIEAIRKREVRLIQTLRKAAYIDPEFRAALFDANQ